jgi:crotonobetainyl-CoA:carnitine CoA-transferase CaiB-like acyl-CoA transferase
MSALKGPLSDLRVVELGQLIAGPFCGQLMGDMGAEVIKVEAPGAGDPMRQWGQTEDKLWWEVIARNKKSITANLRDPNGQDLIRTLIATADILIENFKPGTLEKWGMSPARLHTENPRLIIVRMSGYGQDGPYATRAGFGGIAEAMGGLRAIVGEPDRPPSRVGISIGDTLAATYGCMGALAALHVRDQTGKGQVVDSALYESVLQVMESMIPEYDHAGLIRERSGAILPKIAPSNVYPCADGEFMIGANQDGLFAKLAQAMGQPALATHTRYATHSARGAHQAELDALIGEWTQTLSMEQVEALMIEYGIPAGRVYRAPDMLNDPHFKARDAIVTVETECFGPLKMQGIFPKLSATPSSVRTPAPARVGQHNDEVYGQIMGLSADDIAALTTAGVI